MAAITEAADLICMKSDMYDWLRTMKLQTSTGREKGLCQRQSRGRKGIKKLHTFADRHPLRTAAFRTNGRRELKMEISRYISRRLK